MLKIAAKMNRQLAAMLTAVALSLLPGELAAQGSQVVDITLPDGRNIYNFFDKEKRPDLAKLVGVLKSKFATNTDLF